MNRNSILPDHWQTKSIRSFCQRIETVNPGQNPTQPFEYIDVSAISNELLQITSSCRYLGENAPSRARKRVKAGDVMFATVRPTLKRVAIVPESLDGQIASTAFCILRPYKEEADNRFIYFSLLTNDFMTAVGNLQRGANYPAVTDSNILDQKIPFPPLSEQRAIAAVLAKVQEAIETQRRIVATLKELKAATMAKLFREGTCGERLKQTEIGEMPESWEINKLEELAVIERGKFAHRPRNDPSFYGGMIPFIQTADITASNGRIRKYTQTLNAKGLSVSRIFPAGTILITIAANIGDTGILMFDCAFPDSIIGITPLDAIHPEFLEYYLRTQREKMNWLAPKGTQKNINIEFLRPWPVPLPILQEQRTIVNTLNYIARKDEYHRKKMEVLSNLFSSLIHLLMTGQVRVTIPPVGAAR